MDTLTLVVFALTYLGMILGGVPGAGDRPHRRLRVSSRQHARSGIPVTVVTLAIAAIWLWMLSAA